MANYYFSTKVSKTSVRENNRFDFHCKEEEFANKQLFLVLTDELEDFKNRLSQKKSANVLRTELAGKESKNQILHCQIKL